jgi:uncharacterized protein (DUF983 family)
MQIQYPDPPVFWIISAGIPVAGLTMTDQTTTAGPSWEVLLQTTDEAEWRAECERLGIEA